MPAPANTTSRQDLSDWLRSSRERLGLVLVDWAPLGGQHRTNCKPIFTQRPAPRCVRPATMCKRTLVGRLPGAYRYPPGGKGDAVEHPTRRRFVAETCGLQGPAVCRLFSAVTGRAEG